jgi:hypothetical protein
MCVKISFPVIIAKEHRVEGKESLKPITSRVCRTHSSILDARKIVLKCSYYNGPTHNSDSRKPHTISPILHSTGNFVSYQDTVM